jgi:hypothetical protein
MALQLSSTDRFYIDRVINPPQNPDAEFIEHIYKYFIYDSQLTNGLPPFNHPMADAMLYPPFTVDGGKILKVMNDGVVYLYKNIVYKFFYTDSPQKTTEYIVTTEIIPVMYRANMTFNIMCALGHDMATSPVPKGMPPGGNPAHIGCIVLPYLPHTLESILLTHIDIVPTCIFQIVYTFACFSKLGLTHNDSHTNNIRLRETPRRRIQFNTSKTKSRVIQIEKYYPVIYDYDQSCVNGVSQTIIDNKHSYSVYGKCRGDGNRRDLLITLSYIMVRYYTTLQQNGHNDAVLAIYQSVLTFMIDISKGFLRDFFIAIITNKYTICNDEFKRMFSHEMNIPANQVNASHFVHALFYYDMIPECPLTTQPLSSKHCMSPKEIVNSGRLWEKLLPFIPSDSGKIDHVVSLNPSKYFLEKMK